MIKKILRFLFHRMAFIISFMLIQLALLLGVMIWFDQFFVYFYGGMLALSALLVLHILGRRDNPSYKIVWIISILIFPIFGCMLYLLFSSSGLGRKERQAMRRVPQRVVDWSQTSPVPVGEVIDRLAGEAPRAAILSRYLFRCAFSPLCRDSETHYLTSGEAAFRRMMEAMEGAKRYIFLEYFIVREGVMWDAMRDVLVRKACEGVEVRMIYDDLGCMFALPYRYDRKLEALGIRCRVFGPFRPELSSRFSNRNHRKLMVVDGCVAFTGGINLADEYINTFEKHGHWKDTVLEVRGSAAWYMTVGFLSMWDFLRGDEKDIAQFLPDAQPVDNRGAGYVQPYFDSPLDGETVGQTVYLGIIASATRYVYITTPYLVLDNELMNALCVAAKSGVDVRIITPHIADKWYVHAVTRHNYAQLIESGVCICEYTPGFIHAKSFVSDDVVGAVGTVNLDYRSLYLHFENGVWLYGTDSVAEIRDDFLATQRLSHPITLEQCRKVPFFVRLGRSVLSAFSPLM